MSRRFLLVFGGYALATAVAVFGVFSEGDANAVNEVTFVCPSGQEPFVKNIPKDDAFPKKVLDMYRRTNPHSALSDGEVLAALGGGRIVRQEYVGSRWVATALFSARAKLQDTADAIGLASMDVIRELVQEHNRKFVEESLAQQKGRILKFEKQIGAGCKDPRVAEALSNEVAMLTKSEGVVYANLIELIVSGTNEFESVKGLKAKN